MIFDIIVLLLRFALVWLIVIAALFVVPVVWLVWMWKLRRRP